MAGWISSKLKVAETFLQQIDHQAAESLGKNERPQSDELDEKIPAKSGGVVPLKDQLKKKTQESYDFRGKLHSDPNVNVLNSRDRNKEVTSPSKPFSSPRSNLTDSDWTELLSTPNQETPVGANRTNGTSGIRSLRKDGRRQASSGLNLSGLEAKRNHRSNNSASKPQRRSDVGPGNRENAGELDRKLSDEKELGHSDSVDRTSSAELRNDGKYVEAQESELVMEVRDDANLERSGVKDNVEDGGRIISKGHSVDKNHPSETKLVAERGDRIPDMKMAVNDEQKRLGESNAGLGSSVSLELKRTSVSDERSDSDTDSASSSDSESERLREERRRRRKQILAEKQAAKAVAAIKERENMVARLEGEKESLEKILEERAKQQAEEASELQTTMMETMDAVELEKQKHNNTRMEAFARLAKLETVNADLTRSLATAQWNLEVEVNRAAELRQQIELKEVAHEELRRRISNAHQPGTSVSQLVASKGFEFEKEILEAEYSFITDKIGQLQDKAKMLEANIEMTQKEMENPTVVEVELKRRLGQLTDHLIQKQAQVEALSSEKATLLFRIEAVSRLLEENKSLLSSRDDDLESGSWDLSDSKLKPLLEDRIRSGGQHFRSVMRQLDTIFSAGAVFLRRNSTAKWWALFYLVSLHLWVIYILMSHSETTVETRSGAVMSLENINKTGGV